MKLQPFQTLKHYDKKNFPKDILAGIIIMAVSIPISMGYAQIAGLPAVYGLYGSVFPIILFVLFSTWHKRSHGGSSGADFFCSIVAAGVLFYEGRKTGQFYLRTGYGWIYHRNLHDDHTDAGAKTDGRNGRSRGTF